MPTLKRITKEQAEANKKKQLMLRAAGYNVKVDGSWGPWQEKQYRKIVTSRSGKRQTNQANAAVLALPAAGYAAAQILEGVGASLPSLSLPAVSGSTLATTAPIALTLAGPLYGAYELATGQHHSIPVTPRERQQMTFAPDATRVERPIVISRARVRSQPGPIGEAYVNPTLTHSRAVSMASETPTDSISTSREASTESTSSSVGTQQVPNDNDEQNERGRWRRKKKSTQTQNPENGNTSGKLRRGIKTAYQWSWYLPAGIDGAGNIAGAIRNPDTYSFSLPALEGRTALIRGAWNWLGRTYNPQETDSIQMAQPIVPAQPVQDSSVVRQNQPPEQDPIADYVNILYN